MLSLGQKHAASALVLRKLDASKGRSDHALPVRMLSSLSMDMPRMCGLPGNVGVVVGGLVATIDGFVFVIGDVLGDIEI